MKKGVYLQLPEKILKKLKEEQESQGYYSLQEVVLHAVREHYFRPLSGSSSGVALGRPKKIDLKDIPGRKNIFSKKGKGPTWKWR
ncbi:MAG: hypothetical protein AABY00_03075 [Nanoarchaeota archaeon]